MNTQTSNLNARIAPSGMRKPRLFDTLAKSAILNRLNRLKEGELILNENGQIYRFGAPSKRCPLRVTITVMDPRFYSDIAFGGSIGAGETYMAGSWQCSDLTGLVRIFAINQDILDNMESGAALLTLPVRKFLHWLNRNTQTGSRKNIAAHYDLGNDFFKLMLDETMMYSCALFNNTGMSLYEAQVYRLDTICKKLDLQSKDHLLEIGTGWGGLAVHAAKNYGCRVTTTTISREQYDMACQRVQKEGLEDKVTVLLEDYRNLSGQYDKLVSVEMIEAVGHQYYEAYYKKCAELLKSDGIMLLQAITITDQRYESAKRTVDFIKRYIFPGSCIPSMTASLHAMTRASDLRLYHVEDIGPHYALTLKAWRENFFSNLNEVKKLGYSDAFIRMWEFYLCYCEGGFKERVISDVQMILVKPGNRCRHPVG